jgi:glycosylphosphatidylinositol deacylase
VRPIAAEAANYFHQNLQSDGTPLDANIRNLDFFTVDFNEDITAFHGQTLLDQADYLNEAVRYILSLYLDPQRSIRSSQLPDPTSVIILGHSMGGVVARTMLVRSNYQANSINTIITMSAPHARPPVTFDRQIVQIYDEINEYWREAHLQKWANNNPLWHVTLVSIAGGNLDTIVPSDYASIESLVPATHGFSVFTTGIPTVWTGMDHQAILWCDQFRKVVSRALYEIVDVHRASQTKPRADRMRVLRKRFLTGLEPSTEIASSAEEASTLLTLDDERTTIVPAGERLSLSTLGGHARGIGYLLPIPPQGSPESKRFTLLTDSPLEPSEMNSLMVLLCSVSSGHEEQFTSPTKLSVGYSASTKLACKNAATDTVLLPASTSSSQHPFSLDEAHQTPSFSYLQYDSQHIMEHQFIAVVDTQTSISSNFLIAEFSDQSQFHQTHHVSVPGLVTTGLSTTLPSNRPLVAELGIPSMTSSLLAYELTVVQESPCTEGSPAFAPMIRQYLDKPYESRFFVNAERISVGLHGTAPYLPPALQARDDDGMTFQFWTDPSCKTPLNVNLKLDVMGSLGKLYMRYRTVFAAFPLLIVTLVLRKQFREYDRTGIFVSFAESLDLSLKRSIFLLLLSMTLLSMSVGSTVSKGTALLFNPSKPRPAGFVDFHRNDLLIGTSDPFFWFLVPVIGIVCVGACVILHYITLALTRILAALYGMAKASSTRKNDLERRRARSSSFIPSTSRRRMMTTATLLLLVSFFIPYQFAYLVACLVQLFTVVRSLHISTHVATETAASFYHYAHSILLLMLWILPINLPILAVWIRNLAVHWLTPFSSHHNVLSIMPFLLLVENLTTGRMVPQVRSGLRHVTSVLLFCTALCAAIYGVSHAYVLHHLVNTIAAWLVVVHATSNAWSFAGIGAMFDGRHGGVRKSGKNP